MIDAILPAHLQALIESHLGRLTSDEQTLLEAASVAGVEFAAATVAAALECTDDVVEARCMALAQQGQFLHTCGRAAWSDGTVTACYGFRHAFYHDVIYQRVPAGRQTRWHARIGSRLAQAFGEDAGDMAAALAMHLVRGCRLPQAVPYLRQAGERALARSAHREAVGYFEQALSALPDVSEQRDSRAQAIDLRLALRSALRPFGNGGRILTCLREAESLAVALDDPRRLAQVTRFLSLHYYLMGTYDQAVAAGQRALTCATASGEGVQPALANLYLGLAYQAQGNYHRAIDCFGQTVRSLERARRCERFGQVNLPAVQSRAFLAVCYAEVGRFAEGRVLGDEGLRIAEAVEHPSSRMRAAWGLGLLCLRQGDLHQALPLLERAVDLCQVADLPVYFPVMASALGAAYTLAGCVAHAMPLLTQALEQTTAQGTVADQALCRLPLGEAHLLAGRLEEAHALTRV